MRTPLDLLVTQRSLAVVAESGGDKIFDMVLDTAEAPEIRNVCAKLSVQLADEIDSVCSVLDVSKRRFIEAALLEAVAKAKAIMDDEGVWDVLDGHNGWRKTDETQAAVNAVESR